MRNGRRKLVSDGVSNDGREGDREEALLVVEGGVVINAGEGVAEGSGMKSNVDSEGTKKSGMDAGGSKKPDVDSGGSKTSDVDSEGSKKSDVDSGGSKKSDIDSGGSKNTSVVDIISGRDAVEDGNGCVVSTKMRLESSGKKVSDDVTAD